MYNYHPGRSSPWKIITLEDHHPGRSSPWKIITLEDHHPGRSSTWKIIYLEDHHPGRSSTWKIIYLDLQLLIQLPAGAAAMRRRSLRVSCYMSNLKTLSKVLSISLTKIMTMSLSALDVPKKDLFRLPIVGTGFITTLQCGKVQYSYACEKNHRIPVKYNCSRPDCPECYHNWVSKTTGRIVPRLLALYRPFESKQSKINDTPFNNDIILNKMRKLSKYPYRHIVISFPPDFVGENPFAEVQKRIKQLNLYGVAIYHPYRLTHEAKEKIKNLRNMELYSGGSWEIWHKSGLYRQSDTIYYSPHVHIITSGYIPANLEHDLHQEGFVLKIIRVVGKPDLLSEQSLASLVHYLLTHCGYAGKSKSYRYLGMSGRVTLKKEEFTIEQPLECPVCGRQMYKSIQASDGTWVTDFSMPIFISVKILEYTIQISAAKNRKRKRG